MEQVMPHPIESVTKSRWEPEVSDEDSKNNRVAAAAATLLLVCVEGGWKTELSRV